MWTVIVIVTLICLVAAFWVYLEEPVLCIGGAFLVAILEVFKLFKKLFCRCWDAIKNPAQPKTTSQRKHEPDPQLDAQIRNLQHQQNLLRMNMVSLKSQEKILKVLSKTRR